MSLGVLVFPIWNVPGDAVVFSLFESMMKLILIPAKESEVSISGWMDRITRMEDNQDNPLQICPQVNILYTVSLIESPLPDNSRLYQVVDLN